jgi:hypothetical protein
MKKPSAFMWEAFFSVMMFSSNKPNQNDPEHKGLKNQPAGVY